MEEKLLTVPEAAKRLGVTRAALYAAIREGRLHCVMVLEKMGIPESALAGYVPRNYGERTDGAKPKGGRPRKALDR